MPLISFTYKHIKAAQVTFFQATDNQKFQKTHKKRDIEIENRIRKMRNLWTSTGLFREIGVIVGLRRCWMMHLRPLYL